MIKNLLLYLLRLCLFIAFGLLCATAFRVILEHFFAVSLEINAWYIIINILLTSGMGFYFLTYVNKFESKTLYSLTMVKLYLFRYILMIILVNSGIICAGPLEGLADLYLVKVIGSAFITIDFPTIITNMVNKYITPFIPSIGDNLVCNKLQSFIKARFNISKWDISFLMPDKVTLNSEPQSNISLSGSNKKPLAFFSTRSNYLDTVLNPTDQDPVVPQGQPAGQITFILQTPGLPPMPPPSPDALQTNLQMAHYLEGQARMLIAQRQVSACRIRHLAGSDSYLDHYVRAFLTNFVLNNPGVISEHHISRATGTVNWVNVGLNPNSRIITALKSR